MENIKDLEDLLKACKRIGYKKELGFSHADFDRMKEWLEEETKRKAFLKTAGYKKIENYLKDLTRMPEFLNVVKDVRKKFGFPKGGFIYSKDDEENCETAKGIWENNDFLKYNNEIAKRYGMSAYRNFIFSYIVFNNFNFFSDSLSTNVIKIIDLSLLSGKKTDERAIKIKKETPIGKITDEFSIAQIGTLFQLMLNSENHPIAILIHPYMSQRDILDAVKKTYKLQIEPLQKKHRKEGIKFGTVRRKSDRVEKRNKFIYESRTLKIAKLRTAIREKFGEILDETYIYKIIKAERLKNK
jgi:hypothetical protein